MAGSVLVFAVRTIISLKRLALFCSLFTKRTTIVFTDEMVIVLLQDRLGIVTLE